MNCTNSFIGLEADHWDGDQDVNEKVERLYLNHKKL